jgi:hypothetical protein
MNAAEMGSREDAGIGLGLAQRCLGGLTLPRLEAAVRLIDDVDAALAAHDTVVAVATAE